MLDNYTKLLLHFDGADAATAFTDSAKGKVITAVGSAQLDTAQKKFGSAALLLDGTTDLITTPFVSDFDVAGGDFTIDFWVRWNGSVGNTGLFYGKMADNSDYHYMGLLVISGKIHYAASSNGTSWNLLIADTGAKDVGSHTLSADTWYHIEFSRNGNNWYGFVNGEADWSKTQAGTVIVPDQIFQIGAWVSNVYSLNGWIDEFRFSKGICRHTTPFTPPASPYGDVKSINGMAVYARPPKAITVGGNAQIDTAQSKFSGASALFDGTGDYLTGNLGADIIGTGDFTIDYFVRHTSFYDYITHFGITRSANGFNIGTQAAQQIVMYVTGLGEVLRGTVTNFSANTWHHVAVVRSGTSLKAYVDGVEVASATNSTNFSEPVFWIGALDASNEGLTGWIDEFRFTKGLARWTGNFTPPIQPHNNDSYTKLLMHLDGADAATTFIDNNVDIKSRNGLAIASIKSINGLS